MPGRLAGGVGAALTAGLVVALLVVASPAGARGGNHGCDTDAGTFFSSHFFASGDNIVAGFNPDPQEGEFPRGFISDPAERVGVQNYPGDGGGPSSFTCETAVEGTFRRFDSVLGPGDDSIRMDARNLFVGESDDYEPLPRRIRAFVTGGTGEDFMFGHDGHDEIAAGGGDDLVKPLGGPDLAKGGGGRDLIKAAKGGADVVKCGAGRDKAIVDRRDEASSCEELIVR